MERLKLFDEEFEIKNNGLFYLSDIMEQREYRYIYDDMMSYKRMQISFFNKSMCGNGGTTGMVRYALENKKGLLVLTPNVSICISKENEYKDDDRVCVVYGGSRNFNPDAQVVIATYDKCEYVLKNMNNGGMIGKETWNSSFWGGRTIIIDEYHKMVDEVSFRNICVRLTEISMYVKSPVIFMSATPDETYIKFIRNLLSERLVVNYTVSYNNEHFDWNTRIDLWGGKKSDLKDALYTMLESQNNKQICVFYNSVKDIKEICKQLNDDRVEVLCSKDRKNDMGVWYNDKFNCDKKMHFMTSAYFTGHDIFCEITNFVIIGSDKFDYLSYSERDIKQIIGRERIEGGGVKKFGIHIWQIKGDTDRNNLMEIKNNKKKGDEIVEFLKNYVKDNWKTYPDIVRTMLNYIRDCDAVRRIDMWKNRNTLMSALKKYGYICKDKGELTGFKIKKKVKYMSLKKVKELINKGIEVKFEEYPDIFEVNEYIKVKGMSKFMDNNTTKNIIHSWYKAYSCVKDHELDLNNKKRLREIFGLKSFGRYNGGYLKSCLDVLGIGCNDENIEKTISETFDCFCLNWGYDETGHTRSKNRVFMVITKTSKSSEFFYDYLYREKQKNSELLDVLVILSTHLLCDKKITDPKVSFQVSSSGSLYAQTHTLSSLYNDKLLYNLNSYDLYRWVNEDKVNRLPQVKDNPEWKTYIKRMGQNQISDMYSSLNGTYRFIKSNLSLADTLIVDIDEGLPYSKFLEQYKDWTFLAYPSISNTQEDWNKYRVIFPLTHTIELKGEHNLKVMRLLRMFFCKYEDPNHQLYSFINMNDFVCRRTNQGECLDIPQSLVDDLTIAVSQSIDYTAMKKVDKTTVYNGLKEWHWSLDYAKKKWIEAIADSEEGARYKAIFPIKNNLSDTDCDLFRDWLFENYNKYITMWKYTKRLS